MAKPPAITLWCLKCGHPNYPCHGHPGTKRRCSCKEPACVPEGSRACGHIMRVPSGRPMTESEARRYEAEQAIKHGVTAPVATAARPGDRPPDPALEAAWAAEDPPASWLEMLAEESADKPCVDCGCASAPPRYTGDHTGTICAECGPEYCWDISPTAYRQATEHAARIAARTADAPAAMPQQERDDLDRQAHAERRQLGRIIGQARGIKNLAEEAHDTLDWYAGQIAATESLAPPAALARLEQLRDNLEAEQLPRRRWFRPPASIEELASMDLDQDQLAELASDLAGQLEGSTPDGRPALTTADVLGYMMTALAQAAAAQPPQRAIALPPGPSSVDLRRVGEHVDRQLRSAARHASAGDVRPTCQACAAAGQFGVPAVGRAELTGQPRAAIGLSGADGKANLCRGHGIQATAAAWASADGSVSWLVAFPLPARQLARQVG